MSDPLRDELQAAIGDAYHIERELEGGGMSRVFVAAERALARKVGDRLSDPLRRATRSGLVQRDEAGA